MPLIQENKYTLLKSNAKSITMNFLSQFNQPQPTNQKVVAAEAEEEPMSSSSRKRRRW